MGKKKKGTIITGALLLIAGIYLSFITVSTYMRLNDLLDSGEAIETEATIYNYSQYYSRRNGRRRKSCTTSFEYTVDEVRYIGRNSHCHYGDPIGETFMIYYNINEPSEHFEIVDQSIYSLWPVIFVPIGLGVLIYGIKMFDYFD